jgi:hypothetical protein
MTSTRRALIAAGTVLMACVGPAVEAQRSPAPVPAGNRVVVPDSRLGPVRHTTTRRDLVTLFGNRNVKDGNVHLGEGLCTPGTQVLEGGSDAFEVAWQDAARTRVAFARVSTVGGRWATPRGVRIGTSLVELERLAGRAVTFLGFEWDYAGSMRWSEGDGSLGLRLDIDPRDYPLVGDSPVADQITGDREVLSSHPLIRRLRITVIQMTLAWGSHHGEDYCG